MSEWISVKDRLPDKEGDALVMMSHDGYQRLEIAFVSIGGTPLVQFDDLWGDDCTFIVTHWMPLPEPPNA